MNRDDNLRAQSDETFDVLLIGGGIIGAGCARDLTTRGLRVALVEAQDFGHGTTARSTRLIHGGLRYLEQRDFGLVRGSLREREVLLRNAPHLVRPLLFVTPVYRGGRHNRALLKVGMTLYDALSYDKSLPGHRSYDASGIRQLEPKLNPEGLLGGATYSDGQVDLPERLCWENILAAGQGGAAVANHVSAIRLLRDGDRIIGAMVRDEITGAEFPIRAHLTVNTTGPWVDDALAQMLGIQRPQPFLRRTKGVHLVVPRFTEHAVVLVARSDGRVFFAVPWRGFSIVGTTDTDFTGDPNAVAADESDVTYLQAETRRAFPDVDVEKIYYTWAGVRALVMERSRRGMRESQVSRKDKIHDHAADGVPGLLTVLGGKITAYRAIAEQLGADAVRILGRGGPSRTAAEPYPGSYPIEEDAAVGDETGEVETNLRRTHGKYAAEILAIARHDPEMSRRVAADAPEILAQIAYATTKEMAVTLADALLRRTGVGFGPRQGLDGIDECARIMADLQGWDPTRTAAEIENYRREIEPMRRFAS